MLMQRLQLWESLMGSEQKTDVVDGEVPRTYSAACPYCGCDPYHRVDNGLGMEAVAIDCCEIACALWDSRDEDTIEINRGDLIQIGNRLREISALHDEIDRLRSLGTAEVPEGWQLVPKEPTEEMVESAYRTLPGPVDICLADIEDIYSTMLSASPAPPRAVDGLREALTELRLTARVLLQNAEGCAINHHGADFEIHGPPGWLADAENVIVKAEAALASAAPQPPQLEHQSGAEIHGVPDSRAPKSVNSHGKGGHSGSLASTAQGGVSSESVAGGASAPAPLPNPEVEGRAWAVIETLRAGEWCSHPCGVRAGCGCADAIQSALDAAVAAEREACAKVAELPITAARDEWTTAQSATAKEIAAAIRSRSQSPEGGTDNG